MLVFVAVLCPLLCTAAVEERMEKKVEKELTMEQFDGYLNLLQMFKDMLPKDLISTVNSLNMTEKGEIISFLTDWFQEKINRPENTDQLVSVIKEKLPTVFTKIDQLNSTFYGKFEKLKPETQDFLRTWRDKVVSVHGSTVGDSATQQLQLLREFATAVQSMDSTLKDDLRQQFPTAIKLTEGLGFTVVTTLALVVEKIAESLTPKIVATQIPLECPIELD